MASTTNLEGADRHRLFSLVLTDLAERSGLGRDVFGRVLTRVLINGDPVSQMEIARSRMLKRPRTISTTTVNRATKALLDVGLLATAGPGRGRASSLLSAGGSSWATVGVHLGHRDGHVHDLTAVLTDVGARERVDSRRDQITGGGSDPLTVRDRAVKLVKELVSKHPDRFVLGIGVEIGGHVHRGAIVHYNDKSFSSKYFAELLSERLEVNSMVDSTAARRASLPWYGDGLRLPVVLENDVNALAIQRAYDKTGTRNFAVVAVFDEGVGGAIVRDGQLVRGSSGAAGELGHLYAEYKEAGPRSASRTTDSYVPTANRKFDDPCYCGERGHVQCYATPRRITKQLDKALEEFPALVREPSKDAHENLTEVGEVFHRAGQALGRGLTQLVTCVDPGEVILMLPTSLVKVTERTAGWEYRNAIEMELDHGFSTTPQTARDEKEALTVVAMNSGVDRPEITQATAAAMCVVDAFIDHARGRDECAPPTPLDEIGLAEAKISDVLVRSRSS